MESRAGTLIGMQQTSRAMDRDASIKAFEKSREFRSTFDPKS